MAAKRIQLTVSTPCQQSWQGMKIDEAGRFCSSCQKTVVDFTAMTDQQIVDVLAHHTDSACGRFRVDQLNRLLNTNRSISPSPVRFWGLLTAGIIGYQTAQSKTLPIATKLAAIQVTNSPVATPARPLIEEPISIDSSRVITGRVIDQSTNTGIPGVGVYGKGTSAGINTDREGRFQLSVPTGGKGEIIILQVAAIGYQTSEISLLPDQRDVSISLQETQTLLGEVIVVGNYKKMSFWQRLRNRFRSTH